MTPPSADQPLRPVSFTHPYRSHGCGDVTLEDCDCRVRVSGWVHRKRDHGGVLFIDLRDQSGLLQCVASPEAEFFITLAQLRAESVLRLDGTIVRRDAETVNADIPTGSIELRIEECAVLSAAAELPLPVFGEPDYPEDIRLRYRFLDLRRAGMHHNIVMRSRIIAALREQMQGAGFIEFQTPILTAASPEGARDFIVPSRLHPGRFYALPQAPQQFKQLLMMSGFERYFQVAPCFRDEDARADRSPGEFYQLDIEMAFVEQEDVLTTVEPILRDVFEEFADGKGVTSIFPRISYREALLRYGTDKPDLRNPLVIVDLGDIFTRADVDFKAFRGVIEKGGVVRGIPAPGAASQSRGFFDRLNRWAREEKGMAGLGYIIFVAEEGEIRGKGPIARFLSDAAMSLIRERCGIGAGDAVFFSCAGEEAATLVAGEARGKIGTTLDLIDGDRFEFCWIIDYPMYEWNEVEKRIDFSHNPFSMPQGGLARLESEDPLEISAYQYDIVCNGIELSSGAIRNHCPETMLKAFAIAGYDAETVEAQFGGMLRALRYGAPPHGGIAPGIDRIVMLLLNEPNLRQIVPFPMNQQAEDLLMGSPSTIDPERLRELGLRLLPRRDK